MTTTKHEFDPGFADYFSVADETYDDGDRFGGPLTLADLDDGFVARAREWATEHAAPWPPYLPWAEEHALDHRGVLG